MPTNRLVHEKSPYLLQHAHNPVQWMPWGEEAFTLARAEDKPIFLSIGYSTCHWCHVMERESFENESVAEILNRSFISIKVDREERPDVDRIYMMFVQATTGGGGWPMTVFLTPDLQPFYGGTYFPPENRYGRPGFKTLLEHLAQAWINDRPRILEASASVTGELLRYSRVEPNDQPLLEKQIADTTFQTLRRTYDSKLGGFGQAPKFPRPVAYNFLLRYYALTQNDEALDMTLHTLREMAKGGMNDQLGGGFHRYSVDANWFVPHFEKMLYDQAQLAISYLEAFQITRDPLYAQVARDIFDYVLRDLTHPDGGFYSAEDADSVIDPANPHEKGEGAFYIFAFDELVSLLGEETAQRFAYRYGCSPGGNVFEDPHHEFTGKNILYQSRSLEETARRFGLAESDLAPELARAAQILLEARSKRIRPHLDDKVLTAWNGLMISAFARAAALLDEPRYLTAAQRATTFLRVHMLTPDGVLLRRYRDGSAGIPGFLDDYAFFIQALLDLYQADFDPAHLTLAHRLAGDLLDLFEDPAAGAFFTTTESPELILRIKDDYDGAEPAGNSAAIAALLTLHQFTQEERFREAAERALRAFTPRLLQAPITIPQMLCALLAARTPHRQIVLAGPSSPEFLREIHSRFAPFQILLRPDPELAAWNPALAAMPALEGLPTAYVCQDFTCQLPTTQLAALRDLLC